MLNLFPNEVAMAINVLNKNIKQIFFTDSSGTKKEIATAFYGSTVVYAKRFSQTFYENSTFTIPIGVTNFNIECVAGQGRSFEYGDYKATGGLGGLIRVHVTNIAPQTVLWLRVGKQYTSETSNRNDSLVYLNNNEYNSIVHAGGGGSASNPVWIRLKIAHGGAGGGLVGGVGTADAPKSNIPSQGGSQEGGGDGPYVYYHNVWSYDGRATNKGSRFYGGSAAYFEPDKAVGGYRTGCGGGGYYGGGGGLIKFYLNSSSEYETWAVGGGGGSSYYNTNYCTLLANSQGARAGNGYIRIYN